MSRNLNPGPRSVFSPSHSAADRRYPGSVKAQPMVRDTASFLVEPRVVEFKILNVGPSLDAVRVKKPHVFFPPWASPRFGNVVSVAQEPFEPRQQVARVLMAQISRMLYDPENSIGPQEPVYLLPGRPRQAQRPAPSSKPTSRHALTPCAASPTPPMPTTQLRHGSKKRRQRTNGLGEQLSLLAGARKI